MNRPPPILTRTYTLFPYTTLFRSGPFDVDRDANGLESWLATGSGFPGSEPSVTILYPNDPAVFFANFGYFFHLPEDVDKTFNDQTIGEVDPGDAFRLSFGMAYSINERSSFTLGYKHDFIDETETEVNGVDLTAPSLSVRSDRKSTRLNSSHE